MAILLMIFAGSFLALTNLFMRKNLDFGGSSKGFLVSQMVTACLIALILNPVKTGEYACNGPILGLGLVAGFLLAFMLFFLGKSIEKGPAGLSISVLNSATVFPAVVMAIFFGAKLGFPYTAWHAVGSIFVVAGLFLAGKSAQGMQDRKKWFIFCGAMFVFHILILVLYQWRALLLNSSHPETLFALFNKETIKSQWFSPMMFFVAACMQIAILTFTEKRILNAKEMYYGVLGGVMNGLCTYCMIASTEIATPLENAVIFPIFSVVTIVLSNLWSQKLYQEKVNWRACQVCSLGLVVGTVDWGTLASLLRFF